MASELAYLERRVDFHRRMARRAACREARCAHDAFARAYVARIEAIKRPPLRAVIAPKARELAAH